MNVTCVFFKLMVFGYFFFQACVARPWQYALNCELFHNQLFGNIHYFFSYQYVYVRRYILLLCAVQTYKKYNAGTLPFNEEVKNIIFLYIMYFSVPSWKIRNRQFLIRARKMNSTQFHLRSSFFINDSFEQTLFFYFGKIIFLFDGI